MKSQTSRTQVMVQDPTNPTNLEQHKGDKRRDKKAPMRVQQKKKLVAAVRCLAFAASLLLLFGRAASAQNSPNVTYHGGGIMPTAKIQAIFWGPGWVNYINKEFIFGVPGYDKIAGIGSFYEGFSNSGYAESGDEYFGSNGQVGPTTNYAGPVFDFSPPANGSHPSLILNEVCKMIKPDPSGNGYYPVYTDIPFPGAPYNPAWHSYGFCFVGGPPIRVQFAFFFDTGDDTTLGGLLGHSLGLNVLANASAHELSEARTDPDGVSGWYDQGGEIGDKCEDTAHIEMFPNGTQWFLQGEWSNIAFNNGTGYPNTAGERGCVFGSTYFGAAGDYDGDGQSDIAVWQPSTGILSVLLSSRNYDSNNPLLIGPWGVPGDIPVPGDYDGDGKTDFAVWRPSTGILYVLLSSRNYDRYNPLLIGPWGVPGDIPVPGNYDGDGKADFAVWRPSTGILYVLLSSRNYDRYNPLLIGPWGVPGDIPVPGDYDGDGKADFAVWRPSTGTWYVLLSSRGYDRYNPLNTQWGVLGDNLVPGDYDGDGKTDFAVWRPSTGTWYVLLSSRNYDRYNPLNVQWGDPWNIPVPGKYPGQGSGSGAAHTMTTFGVWYPFKGIWGMWTLFPNSGPSAWWGGPGDYPL
jgi:hypothetical protein